MQIHDEIKAMANRLRELFPGESLVSLQTSATSLTVQSHQIKTYAEAVDWFRGLGVGVRHKQPHIDLGGYTAMEGEAGGILFQCFPDELPPTCRKEKFVERIPKTQTVETGDFIEVERERIVCGEAKP